MNKKDSLLEYRVDKLETTVNNIDEKISRILENHLPHLSGDMKSIRTEVRVIFGLNLILVALTIIISKALG